MRVVRRAALCVVETSTLVCTEALPHIHQDSTPMLSLMETTVHLAFLAFYRHIMIEHKLQVANVY